MAERGNNCLIVVIGQPTAVTNSVIAGMVEEAAKGEHLAEVYGANGGLASLSDGKWVDLGEQKRKTIDGLRRTPGSCLSGRSGGNFDADAGVQTLKTRGVGTVLIIGGLGIADAMTALTEAAEKAALPLQVLGIGVTAENDMAGGDHTPGYGSAARFVASAARDAGRIAAGGEEPIVVLEVPGQNSGWLAAATALAPDKPERDREGKEIPTPFSAVPHAIVLPERPADSEALVDELRRAYQKYGFAVAVTTESSTAKDGSSLDGAALAKLLGENLGVPARYDRPGALVRLNGASIARADSDEAYNAGSLAIRLAGDECSSYLITVQRDLHSADKGDKGYRALEGTMRLDQTQSAPRTLPDNYISEEGFRVTQQFIDWARPLIGGALPEYTNLS